MKISLLSAKLSSASIHDYTHNSGPTSRTQQGITDWVRSTASMLTGPEDLSVFSSLNAFRRDYDVIVFFSNTREFLGGSARTTIRQYIQGLMD